MVGVYLFCLADPAIGPVAQAKHHDGGEGSGYGADKDADLDVVFAGRPAAASEESSLCA